MEKLYVIGLGPGGRDHMSLKALEALKTSQVVVGYRPYISYVEDLLEGKEVFSTGMKGEIERCQLAISKVKEGYTTSIISTGDAGLYGMAGPILELADGIEVQVIPGITAAFSAAAELGSPIMHDYASISLSDLLTPWGTIEKRLSLSAEADFVLAIYNPRSKGRPDHLKRAVELVLEHRDPTTPVGIVKDSGRPGTKIRLTSLDSIDYEEVDMLSILLIGNSQTFIKEGKMVTPRGYRVK